MNFLSIAYFVPHIDLALYPKFTIFQKNLYDVINLLSLKKNLDVFNHFNIVYLDLNYYS